MRPAGWMLAAAITAAALPWLAHADPQHGRHNVILVTLDGARTEEIFGGLDAAVLQSTLKPDAVLEQHPLHRRLWSGTPEERRQKLMPFFWGVLMSQHGSIAGNPARNSRVRLTNRHGFSYPGYAEMLLGAAYDDRIDSNDPVSSPSPTVLEFLRESLGLRRTEVAIFASWEVFRWIAESRPGSLTINAGYQPVDDGAADPGALDALQAETLTPWNSVRHDAYTFRFAMAHLALYRPRVLYLALGETDDWAHDGRYDRVLEAYERTDGYLRDLWNWLQSQETYRDRTSLLLTTDHGRGRTADDWRHHGREHPASRETWMAFVSPASSLRGEWSDHAPLTTAQVAATLVEWMGGDWRAFGPALAPPVAIPATTEPLR